MGFTLMSSAKQSQVVMTNTVLLCSLPHQVLDCSLPPPLLSFAPVSVAIMLINTLLCLISLVGIARNRDPELMCLGRSLSMCLAALRYVLVHQQVVVISMSIVLRHSRNHPAEKMVVAFSLQNIIFACYSLWFELPETARLEHDEAADSAWRSHGTAQPRPLADHNSDEDNADDDADCDRDADSVSVNMDYRELLNSPGAAPTPKCTRS